MIIFIASKNIICIFSKYFFHILAHMKMKNQDETNSDVSMATEFINSDFANCFDNLFLFVVIPRLLI